MYSVQVGVGEVRVVSSCQLFIQEDVPLERPEEEAVFPSFVEELQDVEVDDGAELALQVSNVLVSSQFINRLINKTE